MEKISDLRFSKPNLPVQKVMQEFSKIGRYKEKDKIALALELGTSLIDMIDAGWPSVFEAPAY